MWGALSDERSGLSFTMYNVKYINILRVILRYSHTHTHTHTLSLSLFLIHSHTHIHTHNPIPQFDSVFLEDQSAMP
jgi:hypothetical protein